MCYIGAIQQGVGTSSPSGDQGNFEMERQTLSRRALLRSTLTALPQSAIVLSMPAILAACSRSAQNQLDGIDLQTLGGDEAEEFAAIADRIIPPDDTPGAREAGVVHFMDAVLGDGRERELQILRDGLQELQNRTNAEFQTASFSGLSGEQQDQLLREIEDSEFFATVRYLTVAGMFALPEYGGNRDEAGYQLIGYDRRGPMQPPFGFYDEDYMNRGGQ